MRFAKSIYAIVGFKINGRGFWQGCKVSLPNCTLPSYINGIGAKISRFFIGNFSKPCLPAGSPTNLNAASVFAFLKDNSVIFRKKRFFAMLKMTNLKILILLFNHNQQPFTFWDSYFSWGSNTCSSLKILNFGNS
jgi:hypothetical protein